MNLNDLLLSLTAIVGLFFAVPALAANPDGDGDGGGAGVDADGDGIPDK